MMLDLVVKSLDIQDKIVPIIYDLGRRHSLYGVRERDYKPFERALLETLEQLRGPAFSPEERDAWHAAFAFLSDIMQEGAVESPRG